MKTYYKLDSFISHLIQTNSTFFTNVVTNEKTITFKTFAHFVQLPTFKSLLKKIEYYHDCKVIEQHTKNDYTTFEFKLICKKY